MMRALVMDFPGDKKALDIDDEYMFGKSILVCPVTTPMYSKDSKENFGAVGSRELYLPGGTEWIDFWTGEKKEGGQVIKKEAPLDIIPLYVKAGSILPIGPKVQYANEKSWDDLEIRVYEGANGEFTLYEDEKDNYNYEKGVYSTIQFSWNDSKKTLTISDRKGTFPGMAVERKFNIVRVGEGGIAKTESKQVVYNGKKIQVKL
jgi:alpha-D-xyloside xylohydrolase